MISEELSFVAVVPGPDGRHVAVATSPRGRNTVFDVETWEALDTWVGPELGAACYAGATVVCGTVDGRLCFVEDGRVELMECGEPQIWFSAAGSSNPDTAILGGLRGRIVYVDGTNRSHRRAKLSEYGIERPGRDIMGISSTNPSFITGAKRLLLCQEGATWRSLVAASAAETRYYAAVVLGDRVWVSGRDGSMPVLAEVPLTGGEPVEHPLPLVKNSVPALAAVGDRLVLASDKVLVGLPSAFHEVCNLGPAHAIAVVPDAASGTVLIPSYTGKSRRVTLPD